MPVYTVSHVLNVRVCVVMVGLPARGKLLIAQKIVRYLNWLLIKSRCFNVGLYRRQAALQPDALFFDSKNARGAAIRLEAVQHAVEDMMKWYADEEGVVALLDATNSTRERRQWVLQLCRENLIEPLFLELFCDNQELVMNNILDVKTTSPDYKGLDQEFASRDFLQRIAEYEKTYQLLDMEHDRDLTFVKLINVNLQIIINKIETYLELRIVYYVMNLHIKPRAIWLLRHGESIYNVEGKIGGDAALLPRGMMYAKKLPEMVLEQIGPNQQLTVWTSTLQRTQQTALFLPFKSLQWKALDELDAGLCDGLTYQQIAEQFPEEFKARDEDKYEYRYPGGELYRDVVVRLEPIIMELEKNENILIVTHQAVLRCIYAYFMDVPQEESPWMNIPLHTLIKLEPRAFGTMVERMKANIPAVSTYKEKGTFELGVVEGMGSTSKNIITGS